MCSQVVGSVVNVRGAHLTFMGNNAGGSAGGAMYLTSYTQVVLSEGSTLDFINNIGRYTYTYVPLYSSDVCPILLVSILVLHHNAI